MTSLSGRRRRVLFFSETVSLAHLARPLVLAQALDPQLYEVQFAAGESFAFALAGTGFACHPIESMSPGEFMQRLARGAPLFERSRLERYVAEDLRIIEKNQPDLIVGDFRVSLAVSARLAGKTYVTISNAHWSPYASHPGFPLPEHISARLLGVRLASTLFRKLQPIIFARHARPLNAVREKHGLPAVADLRQVYTDGDHTWYADIPTLAPTVGLPPTHAYLGPIIWSPEIDPPPWWHELRCDRPLVYLNVGSTGQLDVLPVAMQALQEMQLGVMVATAGRKVQLPTGNGAWVADYLPGTLAAARSALMICNGGSASVYQALDQGCPVIGIPSNMDQYLTMQQVEHAGCGISLRSGTVTAAAIRASVARILGEAVWRARATAAATEIRQFDARMRFRSLVSDLLRSGS
ncbi:nucleotide disphospho-sugar-binding domain-containing protein [Accumulibacter sp.]|uniref:glycosyltransferase n=1 Tax=Accumulibacter sp. TaxID=2053492 RepID=UPI0025F67287|nr:nucleotide disphospho-sugar-binding domain-containing protein [Accumulibacter sp.]MCM8612267.1 glycosyl transferase family 1 [Accumulibacter sp.]MCM8635940.1 glycosyl transferase family 1 [Accumulibacter sp.]MCM8639451.1 glycosyl transferase family 1 [Accumulibacter sp.]